MGGTLFYFIFFLILIPVIGLIEKSLINETFLPNEEDEEATELYEEEKWTKGLGFTYSSPNLPSYKY